MVKFLFAALFKSGIKFLREYIMTRQTKEIIIKYVFFTFSLVSIIVLGLIVFSLFREGLPIFGKVSVKIFYWEWNGIPLTILLHLEFSL